MLKPLQSGGCSNLCLAPQGSLLAGRNSQRAEMPGSPSAGSSCCAICCELCATRGCLLGRGIPQLAGLPVLTLQQKQKGPWRIQESGALKRWL